MSTSVTEQLLFGLVCGHFEMQNEEHTFKAGDEDVKHLNPMMSFSFLIVQVIFVFI